MLLLALVLWVAVYKIRRRNMYKLASLIPGTEEELPIIGVAHSLARSNIGKSLISLILGCFERKWRKFDTNENSRIY